MEKIKAENVFLIDDVVRIGKSLNDRLNHIVHMYISSLRTASKDELQQISNELFNIDFDLAETEQKMLEISSKTYNSEGV